VRRRHLPAPLLLQLVRDVVDVAAEFPVEVIAELIGVPKEGRHKIFHWTNQVLGAADGGEVDPEYFISEDQVARAEMEMFLYVRELCEQRRTEPRDDIMSELLRAELDGHTQALLGWRFECCLRNSHDVSRCFDRWAHRRDCARISLPASSTSQST
jgi:hypothetical protein